MIMRAVPLETDTLYNTVLKLRFQERMKTQKFKLEIIVIVHNRNLDVCQIYNTMQNF